MKGVPPGSEFTVQVHANAGKTKDCSPKLVHNPGAGSIVFLASGTTLNVHCDMPMAEKTKKKENTPAPSGNGG